MKNADLPANPFQEVKSITGGMITKFDNHKGITKREMFAMAAMQGLASESGRYNSPGDMAHDAVKLADALLAELERTK